MDAIVQKEILLEEIEAATAFVCYRQSAEDPLTPETISLVKMKRRVISTEPEEIDLEEARKEIEELKKPYLNKPIKLIDVGINIFYKTDEQIQGSKLCLI